MDNEFLVGVATVNISPDRPELLMPVGVHSDQPTVGVLEGNELYVDAMAIRAGGQTAIVATCDNIFHGWRRERDIREAVAARIDCDEKRVIVTSRHNHSSRSVPADRDNADAVEANERYGQKVRDGIVEACVRAADDLRPAEIAAAEVTLKEPIGQNRRVRFGHGGCMPAWGTGPIAVPGEKFVGPAGPDSDRIDFLCARELGKEQPFAILTSHASHVHLAGIPYFNGEVPGGVKRVLQQRIPGITVVYANGTAGDVDMHCTHPVSPGGMKERVQWYRESVELLGRRFADVVVPAIAKGSYFRPAELGHEYFLTEGGDSERARRLYLINSIRLGDIALVSIPGEIFIEFGDQMHENSPFKHLLLLGYNGSGGLGYVGTPISFEQGGYETGRGPAPSPEEERRMVEAGTRGRRIGRARVDTGVEITRDVCEVLQRLAG